MPHSHSDLVSSPGLGTTEARLSREPLATEGEATPGPDDENPFDELELSGENSGNRMARQEEKIPDPQFNLESPTKGDDPFVYDDVDPVLPGFDRGSESSGPTFSLPF